MQTKATEIILKQGDPAPFYGVLSPEDKYRQYQKDHADIKLLTQKLIDCNDEQALLKMPDLDMPVKAFTLGVLSGVVATMAVILIVR